MTLTVPAPDGVRLAYDVTGEGRPIVLIHGFASSREQNWRSTGWIARLAAEGSASSASTAAATAKATSRTTPPPMAST